MPRAVVRSKEGPAVDFQVPINGRLEIMARLHESVPPFAHRLGPIAISQQEQHCVREAFGVSRWDQPARLEIRDNLRNPPTCVPMTAFLDAIASNTAFGIPSIHEQFTRNSQPARSSRTRSRPTCPRNVTRPFKPNDIASA